MTLWNTGGRSRATRVKMYQWKLDERAQVTLDASGNGTVQLSPQGARERWTINFVASTMTNTVPNSTNVASMVLYRSAAMPGNQLAGTYDASQDADSQSTYVLNMSEPVVFKFTGGDPGSIGNVHIEGTRYVWE